MALLSPLAAHAQQDEKRATLQFYNRTQATIRVELVNRQRQPEFSPAIVERDARLSIPMTTGRHVLDFVAFKAQPQHIHRIELDFSEGESKSYTLLAGDMGRYLVFDADSLLSLPVFPAGPVNSKKAESAETKSGELSGDVCKPPLNDVWGVVIWDPSGQKAPRYYRDRGEFLCAVDGKALYLRGLVLKRYDCVVNWTDCTRNEDGDASVVPPIRTSDIDDTARRLAGKDSPLSPFVETWTFDFKSANRAPLRFSKYTASHRLSGGCPDGFRLHYQGFCINVADEVDDDPETGVRGVEPSAEEN